MRYAVSWTPGSSGTTRPRTMRRVLAPARSRASSMSSLSCSSPGWGFRAVPEPASSRSRPSSLRISVNAVRAVVRRWRTAAWPLRAACPASSAVRPPPVRRSSRCDGRRRRAGHGQCAPARPGRHARASCRRSTRLDSSRSRASSRARRVAPTAAAPAVRADRITPRYRPPGGCAPNGVIAYKDVRRDERHPHPTTAVAAQQIAHRDQSHQAGPGRYRARRASVRNTATVIIVIEATTWILARATGSVTHSASSIATDESLPGRVRLITSTMAARASRPAATYGQSGDPMTRATAARARSTFSLGRLCRRPCHRLSRASLSATTAHPASPRSGRRSSRLRARSGQALTLSGSGEDDSPR